MIFYIKINFTNDHTLSKSTNRSTLSKPPIDQMESAASVYPHEIQSVVAKAMPTLETAPSIYSHEIEEVLSKAVSPSLEDAPSLAAWLTPAMVAGLAMVMADPMEF